MVKNKNKLTILVANGLASNRTAMIETLRGQGFCRFVQASDGINAFKIIKKSSPDLIISSMNMLELNAISLLKLISACEHLHKTPFILISSSVSKELIVEAGKFGASAIMVEPAKAEMLREKISSILDNVNNKKDREVDTLFTRALNLLKKGSYEKALLLYEEVLNISEDAEVYYNIGHIKTAQEKFDEALVAFRKALMIDHLHARAYKMMGRVYAKKGDKNKAQHFLEKAADLLMEKNMDEDAEKTLHEVLKLNPGTLNVFNTLGIICRKKKDYKSAIEHYEKALKISPDDEYISYNLGRACFENKQVLKAKIFFERALCVDPEFKEAKKMLLAIEVVQQV